MNTHGTDRQTPKLATRKQLAQTIGFSVGVMTEIIIEHFGSLSFDEAKARLQAKSQLGDLIKAALAPVFVIPTPEVVVDEYAMQRLYWQTFFQNHFGQTVDLSQVPIPPKPAAGRWRLIFILSGMMIAVVIAALRKVLAAHDPAWTVWQWRDDLDQVVTENAKSPTETYALWVRDEQESDLEFRSQSTAEVDPNLSIGVTLLEHLLHQLVHFVETKTHLDVEGFTLCSGSRIADGDVPSVYWNGDRRRVRVGWCHSTGADPYGGVRRAVR